MKNGPIVIIEDDADDKDLLLEVISELKYINKIHWFDNCQDAYSYLKNTPDQPFVMFCDINLPGQNGLEFKRQLDADPVLRHKSIPFIFYSTTVDQDTVNEAYTKLSVQGFFQKGNSYEEIKEHVGLILSYWSICRHPNTR